MAVKRYEVEPYVCPKLTEEIVVAARDSLREFERLCGIQTSTGEEDDEGDDGAERSIWDRLASVMDDLLANMFD